MRRRSYRPDVEGLRAVAILAVVLYHAHVGLLGGGYVGVDVFFVVSGFLITGLLWRELERTGTVSFANFYARRARRLLPASAVVVVATLLAATYWMPPLQVRGVTRDALSSALYVANYRFAAEGTNYLASSSAPSPFQHFWSLGVEEQFYLLWPVLLVLGSLAWSRRGGTGTRRPSRRAVFATLAGLAGLSFVLSLWLTHASQPWAFFSLPTRAWELAAGGMVALATPVLRRLPPAVAAASGWAGMALIGWSVINLSATTPFPGTAALAPILGTAAVLAAGEAGGPAGPVALLERAPLQTIGKLSYSWYLWHWPVLILAPYAFGHALSLVPNLGLALFSLMLAALTLTLVELPLRFSPSLTRSSPRSLAAGGSFSVAAAGCALAVATNLPGLQGHGLAPVAASLAAPGPPTASAAPRRSRADPPVTLEDAGAAVRAAVASSVSDQVVPANLEPSLGTAHRSEATPFYDGCFNSFTDAAVHRCVYGVASSPTTVMLFGDSHATMWFPAVDALADARGWRLEALGKATCPPLELPLFSPVLNRQYTECERWRQGVLNRIRLERPAIVILGVARHYNDLYHFTVYSPQWVQGMASMVSEIRQTGATVVVLGPIPKPSVDVPNCLSAHLDSAVACTQPVSSAINQAGKLAEAAAVSGAGGRYVDPQPWLCTPVTCAAMVDNLLVYRDDNHLTVPFSTWLAQALGEQLDLGTPPPG